MLRYKVAVMGDKDSVMGFTALGIDIFPVYEAEEIKKTIHRLVEEGYAIIYITDIIVIPGSTGSMGLGMNEVRESAKRAIGADVLFGDN